MSMLRKKPTDKNLEYRGLINVDNSSQDVSCLCAKRYFSQILHHKLKRFNR